MNYNKKDLNAVLSIALVILLVFNSFMPSSVLANVLSAPGTDDNPIPDINIGEDIEGEFISGTYNGAITGSAIGVTTGSAIQSVMKLFALNEGENNIIDKIKITNFEVKAGDRVVYNNYNTTSVPELDIDSIDKLSFSVKWNAGTLDGSELKCKNFTIQLGKFKGLNFIDLSLDKKELFIGLECVGTHKLDYSEPDMDDDGYRTLSYTIEFNDNIEHYSNIRGNYGLTSSIEAESYDTPFDLVFGLGGMGTVVINKVWVYPEGHGWGPSDLPQFYKTSVVEKKGTSYVNNYKLGWEVNFHDLIVKHQIAPTKTGFYNFSNVIIEDTLDRHQEFDTEYNGGLPFKFKIPVSYMFDKTNSSTPISQIPEYAGMSITDDLSNNICTYKILNSADLNIDFTRITDNGAYSDIAENVEHTPHSWAIVNVGSGSTSCQKLIINLGNLGDSTDALTLPYSKNDIIDKINSDKLKIQNEIDKISTIEDSSKWVEGVTDDLTNKWDNVYQIFNDSITADSENLSERFESLTNDINNLTTLIDDEADATKKAKLQQRLQQYQDKFNMLQKIENGEIITALNSYNNEIVQFINDSKELVLLNTELTNGLSFYGESVQLGDVVFPQILVEYSDFIDGEAPIAFQHEYQDFKASARNYKYNFNNCLDNSFVSKRENILNIYNNAILYFEAEATTNVNSNNSGSIYLYGFDMLYGTKLKEESVGKRDITNDIIVRTTGAYSKEQKKDVVNSYDGGIQGDNRLGDVVVKKIDADSGKPISNVQFKIIDKATTTEMNFTSKNDGEYYECDESGTEYSLKTNNLGIITMWGIPAKYDDGLGHTIEYTYLLREITPKGYYGLDDIEFKANYKQVTDIEVENYMRKAKLTIKDGEDLTTLLSGAEFKVYKNGSLEPVKFIKVNDEYVVSDVATSSGTITDTLITDSNGEIVVAGLDAGEHYFTETKAPTGYYYVDLDDLVDDTDNKYSFILSADLPEDLNDCMKEVNAINYRVPGQISMTKKDSNKTTILSNIPFELYRKVGSTYQQVTDFNISTPSEKYIFKIEKGTLTANTIYTDTNGEISISGLPWGDYYFVEPWNRYTGTGIGDDVTGVVEPDELKLYAYNTTKYSFTVKATTVSNAIDNGKITDASAIPTCQGFILLSHASSTDNVVINSKYTASVGLTKYDIESGTSKKLAGAKFELYVGSSLTPKTTKVTDVNGVINIGGLLPDEYHIKEITAPRGYSIIPSESLKDFELKLYRGNDKATPQKVNLIVNNERKAGSITITKQGNKEDGTMQVLANTQFALYREISGTYERVSQFNINPDSIVGVYNKKYVFRVDSTNLCADNITLKTDINGKLTISGLPWGKYYLVETDASDYYKEDTTKYYFVIDENSFNDNESTTVDAGKSITQLYINSISETNKLANNIITNVRNTGLLQLVKYDGEKPATIGDENINPTIQYGSADRLKTQVFTQLVGAKFKLYKLKNGIDSIPQNYTVANGLEVKSTFNSATKIYTPNDAGENLYTSGLDGKITIEKLYAGVYYFIETEAPYGYKLDDTPIVYDTITNIGLKNDNCYGLRFEPNSKVKYTIELNNKDADNGNLLAGGCYELHFGDVAGCNDSCTVISLDNVTVLNGTKDGNTIKADSNGVIKIQIQNSTDTPISKYHFKQVKAPKYYRLNGGANDLVGFELTYSSTQKTDVTLDKLIHTNKKVLYGLELTKFDTNRDIANVMSDVQFRLYKNDSTPVINTTLGLGNNIWKTDINGKIVIENLELGDYYFEEVTPEGFLQPVVDYDSYYIKSVNDAAATPYTEIKYDSTRKIKFSVIENNNSQTSTTSRYELKLDVVNKRNVGTATLIQYGQTNILGESETTKLLAGVKYKIYKQNGATPNIATDTQIGEELTTDANGKIIFGNLEWGKYYAVQTSTVDGYKLNNDYLTFEVKNTTVDRNIQIVSNRADKKIVNELCRANVKLIKTEATSNGILGNTIDSVTFKLYAKSGLAKDEYNDRFPIEYTTDNLGKIEISNLPIGDYYFAETMPKDGYYLNSSYANGSAQELNFSIVSSDDGNTIVLGDRYDNKVTNSQFDVQILKVSSESSELNKPLQGAIFDLYRLEGSTKVKIKTITETDINGKASIGNLVSGTYYLREVEAPTGYASLKDDVEFTFDRLVTTDIITITVGNKRSTVDAVLKKVGKQYDDTLVPLANVQFELYKKNSSDVYEKQTNYTLTTDTNGMLTFKNLAWGEYYTVETNTDRLYKPDTTTKYYFTIDKTTTNNGRISSININGVDSQGDIKPIVNEKYYGKVILTKIGDGKEVLKGVDFDFYKNNVKVGSYTTDKDGQIVITNLELGTYKFVETKTVPGYYISDDRAVISFEITPENADINNPISLKADNNRYSVIAYKVDADDNKLYLEGAEFKLYNFNKSQIGKPVYISNQKGMIFLGTLSPGTYYLEEIKAPENYQLNSELIKFVISDSFDSSVYSFKITNKLLDKEEDKPNPDDPSNPENPENPGSSEDPTKPDEPSKPEEPTDTQNPSNSDKSTIDDGTSVSDNTIPDKGLGTIKVVKVDEDNNPIVGVKYELIDSKGNVIDTGITDKSGVVIFNILTAGLYRIRESGSPIGYLLSNEQQINFTNQSIVLRISGKGSSMTAKISSLPYTAGALVSTILLIIGSMLILVGVIRIIWKKTKRA